MACTKQTYTAAATWTASQLADLFKDAFIDAGLMTDWYDSFVSGTIQNRILEVAYDGTKAYGKTYYWFMFTTSGVFLHVATGWNNSTNVPTGTQYLDYFATTTNSTTNHSQIFVGSTANTVSVVRYTSGDDADQSWFVVEDGTNRRCFTIVNDGLTMQPWMDLARGFFAGFNWAYPRTGGSSARRYGTLAFMRGPSLRRDLVTGSALNQSTSNVNYAGNLTTFGGGQGISNVSVLAYAAVGNTPATSVPNYANNIEAFAANTNESASFAGLHSGAVILPNNFTGTNPAFTTNSNPIYHSMPFMPYVAENLPSDFGITFHYATNSFSQGDTFVVSAGTEEWEVLDFAANVSAVVGASPLFLARMV
jgi:hypothetical protein